MQQSRRTYLRTAGALALGVGVAGCSSDNEESGDGGSAGGSGGGGSSGASGGSAGGSGGGGSSGASGGSAGSGSGSGSGTGTGGNASSSGTSGPETPVDDASATDLSGTVGDQSANGLSFVRQSHYSMNGVQGVTGVIENTGDAAFEGVTVHVTVQPGGAGPFTETLGGETLEPGESRRFKFGFGDGAPDEVQGYTIWATGQRAGGSETTTA